MRSAVRGAQRLGMVISVTAPSGIDSNAFTGLREREQLDLGIDLGADVGDVGRDEDEDGEQAQAREHEQQQAAALTWIHRI